MTTQNSVDELAVEKCTQKKCSICGGVGRARKAVHASRDEEIAILQDKLYHESRKEPETRYKLEEEITTLKERENKLVWCLKFYADKENWDDGVVDLGNRARETLKWFEEE